MASNGPHDQRAEPAREPVEDALGRLEERLDRAQQAAERLLADAAERMTSPRPGPPPGTERSARGGPPPSAERSARPGTPPGTERSARGGKPPPAGWQQPAPESDDTAATFGGDADLLLALFGALRDRIPPDLQQRLAEAIREVLLAVRALIDWYLERTEQRRTQSAEIQDIPIL